MYIRPIHEDNQQRVTQNGVAFLPYKRGYDISIYLPLSSGGGVSHHFGPTFHVIRTTGFDSGIIIPSPTWFRINVTISHLLLNGRGLY